VGPEKLGERAAEAYQVEPSILPSLTRSYGELGGVMRRVRTLLLAANVPPGLVRWVRWLIPNQTRRRGWTSMVESYAYWRGFRRKMNERGSWRGFARGTPILMYHAFAAPGEKAGRFTVPAGRFSAQMALLKLLGCRVLGLGEFAACLRENRLPPARSVVLTIDDGFADNHRVAYPILRRHAFPATIFVVTGRIGERCDWTADEELAGRSLCSEDDLREMREGGVEFGAHTRFHPRLTAWDADRARSEVEGSRLDLEKVLGEPVDLFAYPHGDSNEVVERLAEGAGFVASCGVRGGLNDATTPLHALRRTEILGTDSLLIFAAKLWTGSSDAMGSKKRRKGRVVRR